jgi:uncharacterized protein (DUF433 family)
MANDLLQRITIDPNICHGKPCIRGLRYPIEFLLELLSSGMSIEEILNDYDDLKHEDILATFLFTAILTGYLGREKGSDWRGDRFYFLRDLPIEKEI